MKKNVGHANTASNCFISQTTYYVYEATNILFTFENRKRSFKTKLKIDYCPHKTFLFDHRKYSGQSIFEGCMNLPNFLLSYYGGVAVSISIFLKLEKNYNEQK